MIHQTRNKNCARQVDDATRRCCRCMVLLAAVLSLHTAAFGQQPALIDPNGDNTAADAVANEPVPDPVEALQTERQAISEQLRVARRAQEAAQEASAANGAKPPEQLNREVELLKQVEVALAQLETAKKQHTDLQAHLQELEGQVEAVRQSGPPEEKPYSFMVLDHLRDELASRQSRTETLEAAAGNTQQVVTRAQEALVAREQAVRRVKELVRTNTDDAKKAELATALKVAELQARLAAQLLSLRQQEFANEKAERQIHEAEIALLEEKIKWIAPDAVFSQDDLQDQLVEIDKQEADLKVSLRSAEFNLQYAENELLRSRQQLDDSVEKDVALIEQVEARQLTRQFYQQQVAQLNARLQRLATVREIWNRRFAVITETAKADDLITWDEETHTLIDQLVRDERLEQMRIDELRQDVANREKQLQAINGTNENVRRWIDRQREQLIQLIQVHDASIVGIEATQRLAEKLLAEIEGDVEHWSLSEWADGAWYYVGRIWNWELAKVDEHPVTVGKVVLGVILLFLGLLLSRWVSRTLGRRLQHGSFQLNESAAAAIQSVSFYVLLVCCTLTVLRYVNMPLTMFTFLGGAVAIGIGFGSQNIVNNFISGLILLAERPIKVGDLIQIDKLYGTVTHIGARSTRIRTGSNLDIIVPNSKFLESNVVNLTLGDDKLRTQVNVGVIYGSPTRDVTRLLKHAAVEHGRVLDRPEPFVWFSDFGDNALIFELHFWVKVRTVADRRRIESDIRYRIDQLFREAGLVIAFPQRDVHIDTAGPIEVRLQQPLDQAEQEEGRVSSAA